MHLHERLRTELALFGLRPIDLARRTGMDKGYLSRVLSGEVKPTPVTVARIVLAIHADWLESERQEVAA